jgi:hypothetical protein
VGKGEGVVVSTCMQGREVSTRCLHLDRGAAAISRNQPQSDSTWTAVPTRDVLMNVNM